MSEKEGFFEKMVSGLLRFIYSKEKRIERYLAGIIFVGFILRLIAALNESTFADDMLYASQSAGIINSGIISTHSNPALFFYLTDFAYKIFGYSVFASRLWPLLMGTALIAVVFLITKELFNEKIGLFAAFFIAFSNFLIRMTFSEHSLVVFFFSFFAIYFGILYLKYGNNKNIYYAAVLFGLGLLTKYNAPFFVVGFLAFAIFYRKTNKETIIKNGEISKALKCFLIILLFATPFLAFNYMVYHEKGVVDVYFSRFVHLNKTQEVYGGLAGQEDTFFDNLKKLDYYSNWNIVYRTDLVIFALSILGLVLMIKRKEKIPLGFFIIILAIPFLLQTGGSALQKHFAFMHLLFAIPAGYALFFVKDKINNKKIFYALIGLIFIIMLYNLGNMSGTPESYFYKSGTSQLKSFVNNNINSNDLVVMDTRIYTAKSFWMATPNNLLILPQFFEFYKYHQDNNISGQLTKVYFVECVTDDCGWGWIKDNQEVNLSAEQQLENIKQVARKVKTIEKYEFTGNELFGNKNKIVEYQVYEIDLPLNAGLVQQTKSMENFYFAPYMYNNLNGYMYNYGDYGANKYLHGISKIIIYLAMLLSIVFVIYSFYYITKN